MDAMIIYSSGRILLHVSEFVLVDWAGGAFEAIVGSVAIAVMFDHLHCISLMVGPVGGVGIMYTRTVPVGWLL